MTLERESTNDMGGKRELFDRVTSEMEECAVYDAIVYARLAKADTILRAALDITWTQSPEARIEGLQVLWAYVHSGVSARYTRASLARLAGEPPGFGGLAAQVVVDLLWRREAEGVPVIDIIPELRAHTASFVLESKPNKANWRAYVMHAAAHAAAAQVAHYLAESMAISRELRATRDGGAQ